MFSGSSIWINIRLPFFCSLAFAAMLCMIFKSVAGAIKYYRFVSCCHTVNRGLKRERSMRNHEYAHLGAGSSCAHLWTRYVCPTRTYTYTIWRLCERKGLYGWPFTKPTKQNAAPAAGSATQKIKPYQLVGDVEGICACNGVRKQPLKWLKLNKT